MRSTRSQQYPNVSFYFDLSPLSSTAKFPCCIKYTPEHICSNEWSSMTNQHFASSARCYDFPTTIRISKPCARGVHIAAEHDTARAPVAERAGRRSTREPEQEARVRIWSKKLELEQSKLECYVLYSIERWYLNGDNQQNDQSPACEVRRSFRKEEKEAEWSILSMNQRLPILTSFW